VLVAYEHDNACALRVEAAGHVQDGVLDDFLDARLGDGDLFVEGVDGATRGHGVEEGLGGADHLDCW
jgi:hypothetical protein